MIYLGSSRLWIKFQRLSQPLASHAHWSSLWHPHHLFQLKKIGAQSKWSCRFSGSYLRVSHSLLYRGHLLSDPVRYKCLWPPK
jgi:hypothetical protein